MNNVESLLTVRDIAEKLRISIATAYALINQGAIASLRIGTGRGAIRVQLSALLSYLSNAEQCTPSQTDSKPSKVNKTELRHLKL